MDLVSKLVPVTKSLKPTAHFIFEKWICTMEPLTLKQKMEPLLPNEMGCLVGVEARDQAAVELQVSFVLLLRV